MDIDTFFLFLIYCGFLGLFFKKNLLNLIVSFLQILFGINGLMTIKAHSLEDYDLTIYLVLFTSFTAIIYLYAIAILTVKKRSTLNINELTEMRG